MAFCDGRGTNGRGRNFLAPAYHNMHGTLRDHVAWLQRTAAERPWMDLANAGRGVAIFGGSAGGQTAVHALLHHGRATVTLYK